MCGRPSSDCSAPTDSTSRGSAQPSTAPRLLRRHRRCGRLQGAPADVRPLARHRHERRRPHGDVPPDERRSGVPLQARRPLRLDRAEGHARSAARSRSPEPARTRSRPYVRTGTSGFVRNPYFHVWSRAAQPAGLPDTIELSTNLAKGKGAPTDPRAAFLAAAAGRIDVPEAGSPRSLLCDRPDAVPGAAPHHARPADELGDPQHAPGAVQQRARAASARLRPRPRADGRERGRQRPRRADVSDPPARAARLQAVLPLHGRPADRQLDRTRPAACAGGGRALGHPRRACQRHHDGPDVPASAGRTSYVAATLRKLGYRVTVKHYADRQRLLQRDASTTARHVDAFVNGWNQDYPAPSNFFGALNCRRTSPYICSQAYDRTLAATAATAAAAGSNDAWTQVRPHGHRAARS